MSQAKNHSRIRAISLILALLSLPFGCCGSVYLLDVLPSSLLPSSIDFTINLFEENAQIENTSSETFFITPITTTYGEPRVIPQAAFIRQREFPLYPNHSITLTYDAADMPLSGIAVCRTKDDCRLLAPDSSNRYTLSSFDELPKLDPAWLSTIRSYPQYSFIIFLALFFCLLSIGLFLGWLYLGKKEKEIADN